MRTRETTIYHNGSSDLNDAALSDVCANVLLVGLVGRPATPNYVRRLLDLLRPEVVLPIHHDAFFRPLDDGVHLLPGIDLEGFVAEGKGQATVITTNYEDELAVSRGQFVLSCNPNYCT